MKDDVYKLGEDLVWRGPEPITEMLNDLSEITQLTLTQADGYPVVRVFEAAIEAFKPDTWNEEELPELEEGIVH